MTIDELAALLEWLRVTVDCFNLLQVSITGDEDAVINRDSDLTDNRQAGCCNRS